MNFADKLERRRLYSHVKEGEEAVSLLDYLSCHYPRRSAAEWSAIIAAGQVLVNDKAYAASYPLARHDCVAYFPGEISEPEAELHYKIVYADDDLLVIDKPGNLCVHPTGPFFRHTLWHLVGRDYGEIRFINRLDRETSGLLVAARNVRCAARMTADDFSMRKEYLALVFGRFHGHVHARGVLIADKTSAVGKKRRFIPGSPPDGNGDAVDTELIAESAVAPDMSLVRAIPHTGRQHQIRATLFSLGYPLVGDKLYGPNEWLFLKIRSASLTADDLAFLRMTRQALHSARLTFSHPFTGHEICCESPCDFPPLKNSPDLFISENIKNEVVI